MRTQAAPRARGFTLMEILTALVVVVVLAAVAIPLWRNHQLRVRRADAIASLIALQAAQDRHFGEHARYADATQLEREPPAGLGLSASSQHGYYRLELETAEDGLSYTATASVRSESGQADDTRCIRFSIDHLGLRRARDTNGQDRSADCWR